MNHYEVVTKYSPISPHFKNNEKMCQLSVTLYNLSKKIINSVISCLKEHKCVGTYSRESIIIYICRIHIFVGIFQWRSEGFGMTPEATVKCGSPFLKIVGPG